jgi:hypothetical protein
MIELDTWCGVKFDDRIINFQWVEVASCPNIILNGEYLFSKIIENFCNFDVVIDVGASNSIYPKMYPNKKVILFDDHGIDDMPSNAIMVNKFVGMGVDEVKLSSFIKKNTQYFVKIDINGHEKIVLDTLNNIDYKQISCLQFEYDTMWRDSNFSLKDVIDQLPFSEFYTIEHNSLRKLTSFNDDYMYRNIVCGDFDFEKVSLEMNKTAVLSRDELLWDGNIPEVNDFINKVMWWSRNEIRKYTKERRMCTNFPLSTFVINKTIIKKRNIIVRIFSRLNRLFSKAA